jgi:hypothetical protein
MQKTGIKKPKHKELEIGAPKPNTKTTNLKNKQGKAFPKLRIEPKLYIQKN